MNFRTLIKNTLLKLGYHSVRTDNFVFYPHARRMKLISLAGINVILDVGANIGQFAARMRQSGYNGQIVSFEPLSASYGDLGKKASGDPHWTTVNIALGNEDGKKVINISQNSYSSSILDIRTAHVDSEASSRYIGKEEITIAKLDTIFDMYHRHDSRIFMKLDTQGYEKHIIDGAEKSLSKIWCIELEMSLVHLYEGEWLMADMVHWMTSKDYTLWSLEDEFHNRQTGQLLQVNGMFVSNQHLGSLVKQ